MPPKKEAPPKDDNFKEVMLMLLVLLFLWMVFSRVQAYLQYKGVGSFSFIWSKILAYLSINVLPFFQFLGVTIVVLAVSGIVYSFTKMKKIVLEEQELYAPKKPSETTEIISPKNEKWERIIGHVNSANAADWRLAIIEADIMLEDVLRAAGYHGDSLGEMLKAVEKGDFLTIEAAWEAHKVRNQIAHQGAEFNLNEREAKHVIGLYESVFKEFKAI
jgi:hypothetical protein